MLTLSLNLTNRICCVISLRSIPGQEVLISTTNRTNCQCATLTIIIKGSSYGGGISLPSKVIENNGLLRASWYRPSEWCELYECNLGVVGLACPSSMEDLGELHPSRVTFLNVLPRSYFLIAIYYISSPKYPSNMSCSISHFICLKSLV